MELSVYLRVNFVTQVIEESKQRQIVQQFLEMLDPAFANNPLPAIPNLPPKPAPPPDPTQVCRHFPLLSQCNSLPFAM